jgi:AcrR family transcriptional regulator
MEAKPLRGGWDSDVKRVLPRGVNAANRDVVKASQLQRLVEAMIELAATKGYDSVTIADLVGHAGVAKPTFYDHFSDKEECFLYTYDLLAEGSVRVMTDALDPNAEVGERIISALFAFLEYIAEDDNRARVILVESLRAGVNSAAHVAQWHDVFANAYIAARDELRKSHPELPAISRTRALAIVGAVNEPISTTLRVTNASAILDFKEELAAVVTALALATP